jgi:hypothetical protein
VASSVRRGTRCRFGRSHAAVSNIGARCVSADTGTGGGSLCHDVASPGPVACKVWMSNRIARSSSASTVANHASQSLTPKEISRRSPSGCQARPDADSTSGCCR